MIWRFTLVLIKIYNGQIGDQTGLFYTTNPVFYISGNRFVRRTGTFGNLIFSLVPSDNRNTRSTCPKSVSTGIGQTLMSRPAPRQSSLSRNEFFFMLHLVPRTMWAIVIILHLYECHRYRTGTYFSEVSKPNGKKLQKWSFAGPNQILWFCCQS